MGDLPPKDLEQSLTAPHMRPVTIFSVSIAAEMSVIANFEWRIGYSQIPLRCLVRRWFETGSNLTATSFEQVRVISTCRDSSNLLEARRRQVRSWSRTCRRPAIAGACSLLPS